MQFSGGQVAPKILNSILNPMKTLLYFSFFLCEIILYFSVLGVNNVSAYFCIQVVYQWT